MGGGGGGGGVGLIGDWGERDAGTGGEGFRGNINCWAGGGGWRE